MPSNRKALLVVGSPRRHGTTRKLVDWVCRGICEVEGCTADVVDVAHLACKVNGCSSCYVCQRSEEYGCALNDDLAKVIHRMLDVNCIVLATPLYWFGFSAQVKAVVDRMFSLSKRYVPHENIRKAALGLVVSAEGSAENSGYQVLEDQFSRIAKYLTGRKGRMLIALQSPYDASEFEKKAISSGLQDQAVQFGRDLMTDGTSV